MLHVIYDGHGLNSKNTFFAMLKEMVQLGNKTFVLTETESHSKFIKKEIAEQIPLGLEIQSIHRFIQNRWIEYGDTRKIITSDLRGICIASLLTSQNAQSSDSLPYQNSSQFIDEMSDLINCCAGIPSITKRMFDYCHREEGSSSSGESANVVHDTIAIALMHFYERYQDMLYALGYVEENEALGLLSALLPSHTVIALADISYLPEQLESFCLARAFHNELIIDTLPQEEQKRRKLLSQMIKSLKSHAQQSGVVVREKIDEAIDHEDASEIKLLVDSIYRGVDDLDATGALGLGNAVGHHAEAPLVATMVEKMFVRDDLYGLTLFFPIGCDLQNLLGELRIRGISYEGYQTRAFKQTLIGSFVVTLFMLLLDDASPDALSDICLNPFVGSDIQRAWIFDAQCRSRRAKMSKDALDDAVYLNRFLKNVIDAAMNLQVISTTFQSSKECPVDEYQQKADEFCSHLQKMIMHAIIKGNPALSSFDIEETYSALSILKEYLINCTIAGTGISYAILASLSVRSRYIYGSKNDTKKGYVVITDKLQDINGKVDKLIIAGLSNSTMPLYRDASPLQTFAEGIGISLGVDYGMQQRDGFIQAISCVRKSIMLERVVCDGEGAGEEPSGLWEEVLGLYRSPQEAEGFASADIPEKLKPYVMKMDEDEIHLAYQASSLQRRDLREKISTRLEMAPRGLRHGFLDKAVFSGDYRTIKSEYSITEIETYRDCHYRWFLTRKLKSDTIDQNYGVCERGVYIHKVLELLYKRIGLDNENKPIHISHVDKKRIFRYLEEINEEVLEEGKSLVPMNELERQEYQGLKRTLERFIESDRLFLPSFLPSWFELKFGRKQDCPVVYAGVYVKGSIDRVDIDRKGRFVVIDYKSPSMRNHGEYGFQKTVSIRTLPKIQGAAYASIAQRLLTARGVACVPVGSVYRSLQDGSVRGLCDGRFFEDGPDGFSLGDTERLSGEVDTPGAKLIDVPDNLLSDNLVLDDKVSSNRVPEWQGEGDDVQYVQGSLPGSVGVRHGNAYDDELEADHALLYEEVLAKLEIQVTLDLEHLQGGDIAPTLRNDLTRDPGCRYCPARSTCKEARP